MFSSSDLLSHPDRLLADHLRDVGMNARSAVVRLSFEGELFDKSVLSTLGYVVGICHDFGKATKWFQEYIRNPQGGHKDNHAYHASISAFFTYYVASNVLEENFKEMPASDRERWSYIAYYVVYYHHGDLQDIDDNYRIAFRDPLRLKNIMEQARYLLNIADTLQGMYDNLITSGNLYATFNVNDFLGSIGFEHRIEEFVKHLKFAEIKFKNSQDATHYLRFIFLYSVLLAADKANASGLDSFENDGMRERWSGSLVENLVREYKKDLEHNKDKMNELRDRAYADVMESMRNTDISNNRFLTIELPTGLGKTLTAFGASFILRERVRKEFGFTPRIIYSLPFLSIVDQNAAVASKVLQPLTGSEGIPPDLLMEHHHLSDIYFTFRGSGQSDTESYDIVDIGRRYLLMEGWNSEIVVTTFVQLFHSIITNRNASALKFHHIANSIIILDEVQALPVRYFKLLREVLTYMAKYLNVWVILMTATMPMLLPPDEVTPLVKDPDFYFSRMDRAVYSFDSSEITLSKVCDKVMEIKDRDIMVIVNTVKASQDLYRLIKEAMVARYGDPDISNGLAVFHDRVLIYMSTMITPNDRKYRICEIREKCEIGKKSDRRKIIITTQLVEAGVDISVDVIFRDMAPLDSIIQAGGRANRHGSEVRGEVHILRMINENGKEYSSMVYDPVMLDATRRIFSEVFSNSTDLIDEKRMHDLVKHYYEELSRSVSSNDSETCLAYFRNLEFSNIGKEFKLIEEEDKVDLFVAKDCDKEALDVWEHYLEIKAKTDPLERWKRMLRIRSRLSGYIVSVRRKMIGEIDEPLSLVGKGGIALKYDMETGIMDGVDSIW